MTGGSCPLIALGERERRRPRWIDGGTREHHHLVAYLKQEKGVLRRVTFKFAGV